MFRDPDTREEANVALWLPKYFIINFLGILNHVRYFPDRIRVIITAESDSLALNHFEKLGCEMIKIENEPLVHSTLVSNVLGRPSLIVRNWNIVSY